MGGANLGRWGADEEEGRGNQITIVRMLLAHCTMGVFCYFRKLKQALSALPLSTITYHVLDSLGDVPLSVETVHCHVQQQHG